MTSYEKHLPAKVTGPIKATKKVSVVVKDDNSNKNKATFS
jgi:hypothetical protein